MKSNKLVVEDISVHFGGLKALSHINTVFDLNTITGLVGPNGAGKTTLINAITNFVKTAGGDVYLDDKKITGMSPDRISCLGIVRTFQIPRTPEGITVRELLDTTISFTNNKVKNLGFDKSEKIASFCGLDYVLDNDCGSLTLPMLRRLEIARALSCGPSIILLDEVMAGLGEDDIMKTIELVRKIHKIGIGFVLVEHVMSVIHRLCSHVVVLSNGMWLMEGTPQEVFSSSEVKKAYIGGD